MSDFKLPKKLKGAKFLHFGRVVVFTDKPDLVRPIIALIPDLLAVCGTVKLDNVVYHWALHGALNDGIYKK